MKKLINKILLSSIVSSFLANSGKSQDYKIQYEVEQNQTLPMRMERPNLSASISYKGFLYNKGQEYLFYMQPLYLDQVTDDKINYPFKDKTESPLFVDTDSIQYMVYSNFDSLLTKFRFKMTPSLPATNRLQYFDSAFAEWILQPEYKTIKNYHCQKASFSIRGNLQWNIWFTKELPTLKAGPFNIKYPPGFIVQAEMIPLRQTYILTAVDSSSSVADSIFHPREFNEHFETSNKLRKTRDETPKEKRERERQELLKENE